jgi:hypothetical protein
MGEDALAKNHESFADEKRDLRHENSQLKKQLKQANAASEEATRMMAGSVTADEHSTHIDIEVVYAEHADVLKAVKAAASQKFKKRVEGQTRTIARLKAKCTERLEGASEFVGELMDEVAEQEEVAAGMALGMVACGSGRVYELHYHAPTAYDCCNTCGGGADTTDRPGAAQ